MYKIVRDLGYQAHVFHFGGYDENDDDKVLDDLKNFVANIFLKRLRDF